MMNDLIVSLLLIAPALLFFLTSSFPGSLSSTYRLLQTGIVFGIAVGITSTIWFSLQGEGNYTLLSLGNWDLNMRIDGLSSVISTMIAIIGFVVIRFSKNYLDGEVRHKQFITRIAYTIAFIQLMVLSGDLVITYLAWVGTSIGLNSLLKFYPERKKAILAARKKFVIARIGDATLLGAFVLIYFQFGTTNLSDIFSQLKAISGGDIPSSLEVAGILIVITACLKSVQIPFHGWLLEVMETPTPVSALLHAGLLNAGPFLVMRFAFLIDLTTFATSILIAVGATSAIFGSIAATMQPSVKTSLAYSSIGHMGFTLMICGLGVYSASLLHLIAHSFYKAHAFLTSGSLISSVQSNISNSHSRKYNFTKIALAIVTSTALCLGVTLLWEQNFGLEFQLWMIAAIIFSGVLSIHINTLDSNNNGSSVLQLLLGSALVLNCFFLFENAFDYLLADQIPTIRTLSEFDQIMIICVVVLFGVLILLQSSADRIRQTVLFRRFEIHFRNGLYLNAYVNRLFNSLAFKTIK